MWKRGDDIEATVSGCIVKRRAPFDAPRILAGPGIEQRGSHVEAPDFRCEMKRRVPADDARILVGADFEKLADRVHVAFRRRDVEDRPLVGAPHANVAACLDEVGYDDGVTVKRGIAQSRPSPVVQPRVHVDAGRQRFGERPGVALQHGAVQCRFVSQIFCDGVEIETIYFHQKIVRICHIFFIL